MSGKMLRARVPVCGGVCAVDLISRIPRFWSGFVRAVVGGAMIAVWPRGVFVPTTANAALSQADSGGDSVAQHFPLWRFTDTCDPLPPYLSLLQDTQEKELSVLLENALALSVQLDAYPKSVIEVKATVIESDGGAFTAALAWCVCVCVVLRRFYCLRV